MKYTIKKKKKKLNKDDKWLRNWYKFEKKAERNPFL